MPVENLTTWSEVDPGGFLSVTSNAITATNVNGTGTNWHRVTIDKGAAFYSGDFTFRVGPIQFTSPSSNNSRIGILILTKDQPPDTTNKYEGSISLFWVNTITNPTLWLYGFDDGNTSATAANFSASYQGSAIASGTSFYIELSRSAATINCKIYSDAYTTLVTTITITPTNYNYRYVSLATKWETGTAATVNATIQNVDLTVATSPTIYTVANTNTIYANSSNVVVTGTSLANGAFAKLVYANQEILMVDYVANSTQPYFTSPSLANVFASRIQFTDSANLQILNAQSGIIATKIVSFQPPTTKLVHNVTDISEAGNTGSIYYGQSPAITVNDQIVFDSKSSLTYNVSLDSQGYITIDSLNTDANDSFTYRVYESTAQVWGTEGTITFIGESGAAPYFSNKIKMYIRYTG